MGKLIKKPKVIIFLLTIGIFSAVVFYYSQDSKPVEIAQAQGTIYYVCPDGSCDYTHPQQAADVVEAGDTVIVKNGIYTDTNSDGNVLLIRKQGTAENWITFKSENQWGAIMDGENYTALSGINIYPGSNYVRVEDFEVRYTQNGGIGCNDVDNPPTHDVYIKGNKVHHIGQICTCTSYGKVAFGAGVSTENFTFDGNIMYNIGRLQVDECVGVPGHPCSGYDSHDHGMYLDGDHFTIINNVFYNMVAGWAIQLTGAYEEPHQYDGNSGDCDSNIEIPPGECKAEYWNIVGNTFATYNPNKYGQLLLWQGNGAIENIIIQNNIFYQPKNTGIVSYKGGTCNEGTSGHYCCEGLSSINVVNNLVTNSDVSLDCSGITQTNNIISVDPNSLFEDAANHDYRLKSNSPAINTGILANSPSYDIEGNPRDSQPDLGAYEYQDNAQTCSPIDLDCSAIINTQDLNQLKNLWGQGGKADLNQDDLTNTLDFAIMMSAWK